MTRRLGASRGGGWVVQFVRVRLGNVRREAVRNIIKHSSGGGGTNSSFHHHNIS